MTNRILDFSEGGTYLHVKDGQLAVDRKDRDSRTLPLDEIAVIIVSTGWMTLTQTVLAELGARGGVVVVCDERSLPLSMCLPLYGHSLQAQKLRAQIDSSEPLKKRLWQALVRAKIQNQARVLALLHGQDEGLHAIAKRVRSGDPENVEAQAARRYWPMLFKDSSFRRTPGSGEPPNHLLDYGYAVLRGIIARAVCGSGLHPTLGLHHHERDNSFALADDLMEPFRPLVDLTVGRMRFEGLDKNPLGRQTKERLLAPLLQHYRSGDQDRSMFDIAASISASVVRILEGSDEALPLPTLFPE